MNFVEDPVNDTSSVTRINNASEEYIRKQWARLFYTLEEFHQAKLKANKMFTHRATNKTWARLDRFYGTPSLTPYVISTTVINRSILSYFTDHVPVYIDLSPKHIPSLSLNPSPQHLRKRCYDIKASFRKNKKALEVFQHDLAPFITKLMETPPVALIEAWPLFKVMLGKLANEHSRDYYHQTKKDLYSLEQQDTESGVMKRLIVEKTKELNTLNHRKPPWLEPNEVICPDLAKRTQPPASNRNIACLKKADGTLVTKTRSCAITLLDHYAGISSPQEQDLTVQQQLLDMLTLEDKLAFQADEQSTIISAAEVKQAIRHMRDSAPGDDGLKIMLYRMLGPSMQQLLARLFTIILQLNRAPAYFKDGTIISIYKTGDRTNSSNYRPITLLNVDYRIFTSILKHRLIPSLQRLIPSTQTAFLPGRQVADNIWTLQLLPWWLQAQQRTALVAICDIQKAYDTVNREFLLRLCEVLGMSPFLRQWIELILTDTRNRVFLDGSFSMRRHFYAGVRQGCPVSPLLYLLVGHVLHRLLEHHNIGLELDLPIQIDPIDPTEECEVYMPMPSLGQQLVTRSIDDHLTKICALQFADDNNVCLERFQVGPFVAAMELFARGTGQHLNMNKTHLLPIGKELEEPEDTIHGLQVVQSAKILGLTFHSGVQLPTTDWKSLINRLESIHNKIHTSSLSIFGKYRAWSSYGLSGLLYHGEFVALPHSITEQVQKLSRAFLGNQQRSWKLSLICAHPKYGGLGCLPISEHLQARHYKWLMKMVIKGTDALWTKLAWNWHLSVCKKPTHLPIPLQLLQGKTVTNLPLPPFDLDRSILARHVGSRPASNATIDHLVSDRPFQAQAAAHSQLCYHWSVDAEEINIGNYTVQAGTRLLTRNAQSVRQSRYHNWIMTLSPRAETPSIEDVLTTLWKLPVANIWKRPFWEVIADGQLTAERIRANTICGCASPERPGRTHHYLICLAARFLYGQLESWISTEDLVAKLWTVTPPPNYTRPVWGLICIATAYALDRARCYLFKRTALINRPPSAYLGWKAGAHALEHFWAVLKYTKDKLPAGSHEQANLPILHWNIQTASWDLSSEHQEPQEPNSSSHDMAY
jgi:hypothetical protein